MYNDGDADDMLPAQPFVPGTTGAYMPKGASHMQTLAQDDPICEPRRPGSPKGCGGNTTLINQYECTIGAQSWENIPFEFTHQATLAEDFSSVQGVYRMPSSDAPECL